MINAYLQILLLDFGPQKHTLGICDVQSRVSAIVLKYEACSYNIVLSKAPNNNDITGVVNIVLNEAPNSNDTTRIVNNVHLITMDAQ